MNALAFQPVVVVQPVGVDQGDIALTVLGDDLFRSGLDLFGKFREVGASM
jgi:hypothetical protein